VVRWLSASLMLLVCLFLAGSGVIQPELPSVSSSDRLSGWVGMVGYGAIQDGVHASGQGVADTFPAVAITAHDLQLELPRAVSAQGPPTGSGTDQSLTYLRTARLRL
jgi:hypothetical protein